MNTKQSYNAGGHGANNWPLYTELRVSTAEGKHGGESEFQVLLWALTQYKVERLELMEKWRFDRTEKVNEEPDDYTMHAQTMLTIDDLLAELAHGLCLADQQRGPKPSQSKGGPTNER